MALKLKINKWVEARGRQCGGRKEEKKQGHTTEASSAKKNRELEGRPTRPEKTLNEWEKAQNDRGEQGGVVSWREFIQKWHLRSRLCWQDGEEMTEVGRSEPHRFRAENNPAAHDEKKGQPRSEEAWKFLAQSNQEEFVEHKKETMKASPEKKSPVCSMPESGDEEDNPEVKIGPDRAKPLTPGPRFVA